MSKFYIPDSYQKSIYSINYDKLKEMGIKCLLFDLDNTLVPTFIKEPDKKLIEHFNMLEAKGFKVIIFSNALKNRLRPFKERLNVDTSYLSLKPMSRKYYKIMNLYKFSNKEICAIGDQIFTDIKGANKLGIYSILVNPLNKKESIFTKFNRLREKKMFNKLKKENLFEIGVYYD